MTAPLLDGILRRRRERTVRFDDATRSEIVERVLRFWNDDTDARQIDIENRLQRNAKFRGWTEGKEEPWAGASDVALPDMTTDSLRIQDTLHNAVMSNRPAVISRAFDKNDVKMQEVLDEHADYQLFVEQDGEKMIEEAALAFVNDGVVSAFIPWIHEKKTVKDRRTFDAVPVDATPHDHFLAILTEQFPGSNPRSVDDEGWDWEVKPDDRTFTVKFYTLPEEDEDTEPGVEMIVEREAIVYDGPRVLVLDYERVVTPPRSANLQPPGPSNPGGAPHVILYETPTQNELLELTRDGTYDLITEKDLEGLTGRRRDTSDEHQAQQKDIFQGEQTDPDEPEADEQRSLTRLVCFDQYDLDGDGIAEDVIFWVLKESRLLLRVRPLCEMYPSDPPQRPFAEGTFLPVKGHREGMSLLELMEGLHDLQKETIDLMIDTGVISNMPVGFYRAASSIKRELLRMSPGDMIPVSDPTRDVSFPFTGNPNGVNFGINLTQLTDQMREKLTVIGDLQLGRVPTGKASALRTLGGVRTILSQGEARPERILRRFFMFLVQMHRQIHERNKVFLKKDKQFRVSGYVPPDQDPYREIKPADLRGEYRFDFNANVQNASKIALNEALDEMMASYINPLTLQLGLIDGNGVYRLLRDKGKALGQSPDRYLKAPDPNALDAPILAEEAIADIFDNSAPQGPPLEGAEAHLEKLKDFTQLPEFNLLTAQQTGLFNAYLQQMSRLVLVEQRQQALLDAAGQFPGAAQQPAAGANGGALPTDVPQGTQVNPNENLNESLAGSGGGAQT